MTGNRARRRRPERGVLFIVANFVSISKPAIQAREFGMSSTVAPGTATLPLARVPKSEAVKTRPGPARLVQSLVGNPPVDSGPAPRFRAGFRSGPGVKVGPRTSPCQ